MMQYKELVKNILLNGVEKESGRENMPNTIGISHATIKMDMKDGFPLMTTKKMYWKGIVHELLWFLRGNTNIKYLVDNNVNIWNGDAYRWYLKIMSDRKQEPYFKTIEHFIDVIKNNPKCYLGENNEYNFGDLGKVYGYQWRNQNGVDQIKEVLNGLKTNPYSRYHIIDGWNKADFPEMALPPCHLLYQFIVRPISQSKRMEITIKQMIKDDHIMKPSNDREMEELLETKNTPKFYLDLNMYQRSCDVGLGLSFNLASMSLLLHIFAKACNMIPGKANWIGGDAHIYLNHIKGLKEQIKRTPFVLPILNITKSLNNLSDILTLSIDDFELNNYQSHDTIKLELFTGLKK